MDHALLLKPTRGKRFLRVAFWVAAGVVGAAVGGIGLLVLFLPMGSSCPPLRRTHALADIKGIKEALYRFHADCGFYPTTHEGLEALVPQTRGTLECGKYNQEGYLDQVPIDPCWNPYAYLSDGKSYVIKCYGADGIEGGDGKNADIDSRDDP